VTGSRAPEAASGTTPYAATLFQQPWWLDAVAPGRWAEATVRHGDRVVARMPYVLRRRRGVTELGQPRLTPTLGPWLDPSPTGGRAALTREMRLLGELIEALPAADRVEQAFAPERTNALPFVWAGYHLELRYAYRLEPLDDPDAVWAGVDEAVQGQIRRAEATLTVRDDLPIGRFIDEHRKSPGQRTPATALPASLIERVDGAAAARGARTLLAAEDAAGRVHAVSYVVHDDTTAYALLAGGDPALRGGGAEALLRWEAVRRLAGRVAVLDLGGSPDPDTERDLRRLGARPCPHVVVSRHRRLLALGRSAHEIGRRLRARAARR
jgi:hypothetical protein